MTRWIVALATALSVIATTATAGTRKREEEVFAADSRSSAR